FLVVTAIILLLVCKALPSSWSPVSRLVTALVLFFFYSSMSEWCQCQPDTWMLLPATGALCLRQRQVQRLLLASPPASTVIWAAVGEGVLWGLAFLIKPFAAFPALACFFLTLGLVWRKDRIGKLAVDAGG